MNNQTCRFFIYLLISWIHIYGLSTSFAGIPEPGIIYYGKVYDKSNNLLTNGVLNLTLSTLSGSTSIAVKTKLKEIKDEDNTYSFFVLIPVEKTISGYPSTENTLPFSITPTIYYRTASVEKTDIKKIDKISISSSDYGNTKYLVVLSNDQLPIVKFSSSIQSVLESDENVLITLTHNTDDYEDIIVPFTVSGTSDKMDHQLSDSYVTIKKGKMISNLTVPINNDNISEPDETIVITMGELFNAQWGNSTIHIVTIIDDDTFSDIDMDGIPDQWEYKYFGNLTDANSFSDYDKDGYLDKIEYEFSNKDDSNGTPYDPLIVNAPGDEKYIEYNLDVDGNSIADGATDGLLLIRYLFENRGDNLINGVVSENCTRCTTEEIEGFLTIIKSSILDVDGDGIADGATDGLLLIRYLFENRGNNLINGVVSKDCFRCKAEEIEYYLNEINQ